MSLSPETYDYHPGGAEDCLVIAHGAGSNRRSPLLIRIAEAFSAAGISVIRMDLPYRVKRPTGSPGRGSAAEDQAGIAAAAQMAREMGHRRVLIGGHSYGGRQSSMIASDQPGVADGLLLLAYPLRPARTTNPLSRTTHFPGIRMPVLFFHGTRDSFGTPDQIREAAALITGPVEVVISQGDGHDLSRLDIPNALRTAQRFLLSSTSVE